jgi:hypothetical protein
VREIMHTLPPGAQEAIRDDLEGTHQYVTHAIPGAAATARHRQTDDDAPTVATPIFRLTAVAELIPESASETEDFESAEAWKF